MDYHVFISGKFTHQKIKITYEQKRLNQAKDVLQFIESKWNDAIAKSPKLYNGKLFRVAKTMVQPDMIQLHLEDTDYKEYLGTRNNDFLTKFGSENISNPLSVGAVVQTRDNKLLFGRRHFTEWQEGKIAIASGYVDPEHDMHNGNPDIFHSVVRELSEEFNIRNCVIKNIICYGLIFNKIQQQTYIPFLITLENNSEDVSINTIYDEFSNLIKIENDKKTISAFIIKNKNELSDITVPSLQLHLKYFK